MTYSSLFIYSIFSWCVINIDIPAFLLILMSMLRTILVKLTIDMEVILFFSLSFIEM